MKSIKQRLKTPAVELLDHDDLTLLPGESIEENGNSSTQKICKVSAAKLFNHTGMLILKNILGDRLVTESSNLCVKALEYLRMAMKENKTNLNAPFKYKEISRRGLNRYDVNMDLVVDEMYGKDHMKLYDKIFNSSSPWLPIVQEIFQTDDFYVFRRGVVYNEGGSTTQQFHSDGKHLFPETSSIQHLPCHCVHLFFPVVDVVKDLGGTELLPGSHKQVQTEYTLKVIENIIAEDKLADNKDSVTPLLTKGDVLFFDYRTIHRGTTNTTLDTSRPLIYITYARKWFGDDLNFGDKSVFSFNNKNGEKSNLPSNKSLNSDDSLSDVCQAQLSNINLTPKQRPPF